MSLYQHSYDYAVWDDRGDVAAEYAAYIVAQVEDDPTLVEIIDHSRWFPRWLESAEVAS